MFWEVIWVDYFSCNINSVLLKLVRFMLMIRGDCMYCEMLVGVVILFVCIYVSVCFCFIKLYLGIIYIVGVNIIIVNFFFIVWFFYF